MKEYLLYHIYLIQEEGHLKDPVAFAHGHSLSKALKAGAKVRCEESGIVAEESLTDAINEENTQVKAGVISEEDYRKATHLFCLFYTNLLS